MPVAVGLSVASTARLRWRQVDEAMRRGEPLPTHGTPVVVTLGVVVAGGLALVLVLLV